MRIISKEELDLVSGGAKVEDKADAAQLVKKQNGWLSGIGEFLSGIFGGGSAGPSCQPSSSTTNGVTTTQSCGANGVSTTTQSGPGFFSQSVTTPNAGGNASASFGGFSFTGGYGGGSTTIITTCMGGRCTTAKY